MRSLSFLLVGLLGGSFACTSFSGANVPDEGPGLGGAAGKGGGGLSGNSGQAGSSSGGVAGQAGSGSSGAAGSSGGAEASGGGGTSSSGGAGGSASGTGGSAGTAGAGGSGGTSPQGWQGPFRVVQAKLGQEPANFGSCGDKSALVLVAGISGPSPCTSCSCGAMTGVTCNGGGLTYALGTEDCLAANLSIPSQDWPTNCIEFNAPSNGKIVAVPLQTSTQGGSCSPEGGAFQPGAYAGDTYKLCEGTAGSGEKSCMLGPAGAECPEGWPSANSVAEGFKDNRSCGPCSCEPLSKPSCNTDEFDLMQAPGCVDFGPFPHVGQQCTSFDFGNQGPGKIWSVQRKPATPQGAGSCTPKGGGVLGSILLEGLATLCCAD